MTEQETRPSESTLLVRSLEKRLDQYERNLKEINSIEERCFRNFLVAFYHGDSLQIVVTHNLGLLFVK